MITEREVDAEKWNTFKFRFLRDLRASRWSSGLSESHQLDFMPHYLKRMERGTKWQTMPPSPASRMMTITASRTENEEKEPVLEVALKHDLFPETKELIKSLPKEQLLRRSRVHTSMWRPTQQKEILRRTRLATENRDTLLKHKLKDSVAMEAMQISIGAMQKRLSLDMDHLAKYAKDHANSSAASGSKWNEADIGDKSFWTEVFDFYDEMFENMIDWTGRTPLFPFNLGGRARTKAEVNIPEPDGPYDEALERARIVMFYASLSSPFCMVPDKAGLYAETISGWEDLFDFDFMFVSPLVYGGEAYQIASDAIRGDFEHDVVVCLSDDANHITKHGKKYVARDGVNWEGQAGTILGEPFYPCMTKIRDTFQIPSGVWNTSLNGTLANMATGLTNDIPSVLEEEVLDTKVKFMLGLQYEVDPLYPRTQGIKLSQDAADKSVSMAFDEVRVLKGKHSTQERLAWLASYEGRTLDGESLLSGYKGITPGEFVSGDKLRKLVLDRTLS